MEGERRHLGSEQGTDGARKRKKKKAFFYKDTKDSSASGDESFGNIGDCSQESESSEPDVKVYPANSEVLTPLTPTKSECERWFEDSSDEYSSVEDSETETEKLSCQEGKATTASAPMREDQTKQNSIWGPDETKADVLLSQVAVENDDDVSILNEMKKSFEGN